MGIDMQASSFGEESILCPRCKDVRTIICDKHISIVRVGDVYRDADLHYLWCENCEISFGGTITGPVWCTVEEMEECCD
jgi:hypothetical protein